MGAVRKADVFVCVVKTVMAISSLCNFLEMKMLLHQFPSRVSLSRSILLPLPFRVVSVIFLTQSYLLLRAQLSKDYSFLIFKQVPKGFFIHPFS